MDLPEDFLHYIWKCTLYESTDLRTHLDEELRVLDPGQPNHHSGPDFSNARILIGNTLWAGNVEIHIRSSDWLRHQHQQDPAYQNVILHVVFEHDKEICRDDGSPIPSLILKQRIPEELRERYLSLMGSLHSIPCQDYFGRVNPIYIRAAIDRAFAERLEQRSHRVFDLVQELKGSWEEAFYLTLARNFGFQVNALPFEMLARSLPLNIIQRYADRSLLIEALLFGQAGFLQQKLSDGYPRQLQAEYRFLKNKHRLRPIEKYLWKFMRLRPSNFPGRRLAQFAALLSRSHHLLSHILEISDLERLRRLFSDLEIPVYWRTHYRFDEEVTESSAEIGQEAVHNLLINTVSVFLAAYGKYSGEEKFLHRSVSLLEQIPAEQNRILRLFQKLGYRGANALESQALVQLKKYYCDEKKCLSCELGSKLVKN